VRPGLHHLGGGAPDIVWWDPAILPPEPEEHAPLRNQRVLEADTHGAAAASEANHASWKNGRQTLLTVSSRPALKVQTITSLASNEHERVGESDPAPQDGPLVLVETISRASPKRPGGKRFGALVHAVLASIELTNGDDVQHSACLNGRLIGATDEEIEASIEAVRAAFEHPVMRRAASRRADELRRETPVMMKLKDGSIAEGVVDLAFPDNAPGFEGWTIVDFKTDREFAVSSGRYITQVKLYAGAIGNLMRVPTQGVLLVV
jgi:ATP-dependent exoDNAse (exonuclease V) beta subunit